MGVIHKCIGDWNAQPEWSGSRQRSYDSEETRGVTETWLIGKAEGAKNFALRYYEVEPYGFSQEESHEHDHGIIILHGEGEVQLKDKTVAVEAGDVIYILPNERHLWVSSASSLPFDPRAISLCGLKRVTRI
jgi:quercetin dioxygenase-like cupin family protein